MHTTNSDTVDALMLLGAITIYLYRWKILFYVGIGMVLLIVIAGFTKPHV